MPAMRKGETLRLYPRQSRVVRGPYASQHLCGPQVSSMRLSNRTTIPPIATETPTCQLAREGETGNHHRAEEVKVVVMRRRARTAYAVQQRCGLTELRKGLGGRSGPLHGTLSARTFDTGQAASMNRHGVSVSFQSRRPICRCRSVQVRALSNPGQRGLRLGIHLASFLL